jgi:hypothetical protein
MLCVGRVHLAFYAYEEYAKRFNTAAAEFSD